MPRSSSIFGRVNANGRAIAPGHPLVALDTRLAATPVRELELIDGQYELQVMCEGGGWPTHS
ncbi:MAG: hypothetical protein GKR86_00675 [Ilumatobacter sp.]|nr:hypothetical protein [Ilumatobacter sp.]